MIKRILTGFMAVVLSISMAACFGGGGPLSKLDTTLDYAPFFFQGLVISNTITQAEADRYKAGVVKFETIADETKSCLSANVKPDGQCYLELGSAARQAVQEFYPASAQGKIGQFVALLNDVINLIVKKNTPTLGSNPVEVDRQLTTKINELNKLVKGK